MDSSSSFLAAVNSQIAKQLDSISDMACYPEVAELITPLRSFTSGGKRGRAKLVALGTRLGGGEVNSDTIHTAAALELFQAFALIHDDIIDHADTRRNAPALHRSYGTTMGADIGVSAAILAGDLMMGLADREISAVSPNPQFLHEWADMCTEVAFGQYLDTRFEVSDEHDVDRSFSVIRSKSANYSVVYPLVLGYILAGASGTEVARLKAAALPLGEAFQLRDDYLGVFGDAALTGKPSGCDLIEGKKTVLLAIFAKMCPDAPQLQLVGKPLSPVELDDFRSQLRDCGAVQAHEELINQRWLAFVSALNNLDLAQAAANELLALGKDLVQRES